MKILALLLSLTATSPLAAQDGLIPSAAPTVRQDSSSRLNLIADLTTKTLTIRQGLDTINVYQVSIGAEDHPTPTGEFTIKKIVWNPSWTPPKQPWAKNKSPTPPAHPDNPMKRVKIFFQEPDYYIHGTDDLASLGKAASHGCLRMDPEQAAIVARYIMEHGGSPKSPSWLRRLLRFPRQERFVTLSNPITILVTAS